ncbi:hypothetical protein APHAL10511_005535 [Amanita phalloides]|nr:hypothetical protein APHAL10511_005535 [Amanita phalloides]
MLLKTLQAAAKDNVGLLLVIASEALYTMIGAAAKVLTTESNLSMFEVLLVEMIIIYFCSVAHMYYAKIQDPIFGPPGVRLLLFCRGFMGSIAASGIYYSLQHLPLSDAAALTFLVPLCTAIAGSILLKEKFTRGEALAGIVSLLGVLLISRPSFIFDHGGANKSLASEAQRLIAVGVAMIGVLGAAGAFICIRAVGKRAHPLHNVAYLSFLSTVQSAIAAIIMRIPIVLPARPLFLSILVMNGIFGFLAQTLMTMGYQLETAGRASMGIYVKIIFALILDRVLFGTVPGLLSILGTTLILGPGIYAALAKMKEGGRVRLDEDARQGAEEGLYEGG